MSTIFLDGATNIEQVLRNSAKKQLDSYADEWIIIFEALQNALDAVENIKEPKVKIIFDIANNKVSVFDNGIGFPPNKEFFGLGRGSKFDIKDFNIRGEHGVGIKMVVLCSKQFELITKHDNKLWYARFNDGYKFLSSAEKEEFNSNYQKYERLTDDFSTLVEYTFPTEEENPLRVLNVRKFLRQIFDDYDSIIPFHYLLTKKDLTSIIIENYFRKNSYSGDVNRLFDNKNPTTIEIKIIRDSSLTDEKLSEIYPDHLIKYWEYSLPITFPAKYWDVTEFYENPVSKGFLNEEMLKSYTGKKFGPSKLWAIKITDKEELKNLLKNPLMKDYYDFNEFDRFIEKIRGIYLVIASASKSGKYNINQILLGKPDQIIAADGVITTNQIRAPKRGKNQNYLNNIHFVINIDERVNYGKQGVKNPILLSWVYRYFEESYVKKLVDLAISVAGKQAVQPPLEEPEIVVTELDDLEDGITIKKVPVLENTLIALFYELIGQGILKNIQTYQLSSIDQYDGKINLVPPRKTEFRKIERDDDLSNIEFKVRLIDLIDDFESQVKELSKLDLAVIWDKTLPSESSKYYLLDIDDSSYAGLNISQIKDVLSNMEGEEVPLLVLSDFVKVKSIDIKA